MQCSEAIASKRGIFASSQAGNVNISWKFQFAAALLVVPQGTCEWMLVIRNCADGRERGCNSVILPSGLPLMLKQGS